MPTTTTLPLHHQPHHRNSISNLLINKEKTNDSIPPLPSSNTFENRTSPILSSTSRKFCALVVVTIILCYSFIKSTSFTKRENENGTTLSLSTTVSGSAVNDYLNINPLAWAPTLSDKIGKSAFSKSQFTTEALEQNELNPVSAVILRVTDDDKSIIHTVNHLLKYPFISDISIFNQVKNRPLTLKSLRLSPTVKSTININFIESTSNNEEDLKSLARFTICATASRLYCYFQDDNYINPFMDSLYTNFLRFPSLIHANAKPSHFENEMAWRFSKADIRLHTGYADFRYGAFVPRWKVQNFLTQLGKSGFDKEKLRQADHYFSIWTNQYPWLLSNPPYMAKGGTKATDGDIAYLSTLDHYTYDAVRHLSRSLTAHQSEAPQDYFDRREEVPPLVYRDVRSSCANDRCLFMTNLDPFVKPTDIDFDYRNITSILAWEKAYAKLSTIPNSIEWDEFSYHQAVDNDPNTCWHTIRTPKKHDYFGLMFVGSTRSDKVTLYTTNDLLKQKYHPEKQFSISVLQNDDTWIQCKLTMIDNNNSLKATSNANPDANLLNINSETGAALNNVQRVTFNLNCPNIKYFKALKVTFLRDQKEPFEICGLTLDNVSV